MVPENKGSVLCVDDDPAILRSLEWLLEKDFSVKTAAGGEEGLQLIKENDFDVIISDQRMPSMTGAQFLAQAKVLSPRSMRLLLTGYSDMSALLSSVNEAEIWRFIKKPWDNKELKYLVETAARIAKESAGISFETPVEIANGGNVLLISDDEEIRRTLAETLGQTRIICAYSLGEALQVLSKDEQIALIVSEAKLGTTDVTPFLTLLKQNRPEIVSIVLAHDADVEQLVTLINRGQIYRFVSRPVKKGYLKLVVANAVAKHVQLTTNPVMKARYAVTKNDEIQEQALIRELARKGQAKRENKSGQSLHGLINAGFKKLFGRD